MKPVTQEQLRAAGFSGVESYRDDTALRLLCAFNGVDPEKAPPAWWAHPNQSSRAAWQRVADEAQRTYGPGVATGKAKPMGDLHQLWDELSRRIRDLSDDPEVISYLDANEYGLAFEIVLADLSARQAEASAIAKLMEVPC